MPVRDRLLSTIVLLGLLSAPVCAYLSPDLARRRTELGQLLPYAQVVPLQGWVNEQPVPIDPSDFNTRLKAKFADVPASPAWTFYAGHLYLERLDATVSVYTARLRGLDEARVALADYESRAHDSLRGESEPSELQVWSLPEAEPNPTGKVVADPAALTVYRRLPWPEQGWSRSQRLQLLEAARADRERADSEYVRVESALKAFSKGEGHWLAWLGQLAVATRTYSQEQLLTPAPEGGPLPSPAP